MVYFINIDINKWFQFPEILVTIGVVLLFISILLIIIAFLTTDKDFEGTDNSSVNEKINDDYSKKETDLSKAKELKSMETDKKKISNDLVENKAGSSKIDTNKEKTKINEEVLAVEDNDDEDIELL